MTLDHLVPEDIAARYEVKEWRNAIAVLIGAHPQEWSDIVSVLRSFHLLRSDILAPGGRKSLIAEKLDGKFYGLDWVEKSFKTGMMVDDVVHETPTHGVGEYVRDGVSTNGIESVSAVLKRGLHGVYHHASDKHLHRYVDEFTFRLNDADVKNHTLERLACLVSASFGSPLTYKESTA